MIICRGRARVKSPFTTEASTFFRTCDYAPEPVSIESAGDNYNWDLRLRFVFMIAVHPTDLHGDGNRDSSALFLATDFDVELAVWRICIPVQS